MALPPDIVKLIESLRQAWPVGRTVDALARELAAPPWRVGQWLGQIESLGVAVEQGGAVRIDPTRLPLLADVIEHGLAARRVGQSVVVFPQTSSTNDVAWQAARRRDSDGLVVLAESQSRGRGRQGRSWADRPGQSLLLSVLLLDLPPIGGLANQLMMTASIALAEAVEAATRLSPTIRWPNDLYLAGRKLAGILVESRTATATGPADVVIGIGLNCNQSPGDYPPDVRARAVSLAAELGQRVDRTAVLRAILRRLDGWLAGGPADPQRLHRAYLERMDHQARRVRILHNAESFTATIRDVDPIAGLIVEIDGAGVAHFPPSAVSLEWL